MTSHVPATTAMAADPANIGRFADRRGLANEPRQHRVVNSIAKCNSDIAAHGKGKRWEQALMLLTGMKFKGPEPTVSTWNAAGSATARGQKWERATALLSGLASSRIGLRPDRVTCNTMADGCRKNHQWSRVVNLLAESLPAGGIMAPRPRATAVVQPGELDATGCGILVAALGDADHWQSALQVLFGVQSRGIEVNVLVLSAGIKACEQSQQWQHALLLLASIRRICGVVPDRIAFSAAISACEKGGQWQWALALLREMPTAKLAPDKIAYSAVVSACDRGHKWTYALALFKEMTQKGLHPDVVAFGAVISACSQGRQWELALSLLGDMVDASLLPNLVVCNAAISVCAESLKWSHALALFGDLEDRELQPDIVSFSSAISACEKAQGVALWLPALDLLQVMKRKRLRSNVIAFSAAASCCEKNRCWEWSSFLLPDMLCQAIEPTAITCNAVASACEKSEQWREALAVLCENLAPTTDFSEVTCSLAVAACERGGNWQLALAVLADIRTCKQDGASCKNPGNLSFALGAWDAAVNVCADSSRPAAQQNVQHLLDETASWTAGAASGWSGPVDSDGINGFLVLASDLLRDHGRLYSNVASAIQRCVLHAALPSCLRLAGRTSGEFDRLVEGGRRRGYLGEEVLERQATLGSMHTIDALRALEMTGAPTTAWSCGSRLGARRNDPSALALTAPEDGIYDTVSTPGRTVSSVTAQAVVAWAAATFRCGHAGFVHNLDVPGHSVGWGWHAPRGERILPVFVEHDRSPHAERRTLLKLLDRAHSLSKNTFQTTRFVSANSSADP